MTVKDTIFRLAIIQQNKSLGTSAWFQLKCLVVCVLRTDRSIIFFEILIFFNNISFEIFLKKIRDNNIDYLEVKFKKLHYLK